MLAPAKWHLIALQAPKFVSETEGDCFCLSNKQKILLAPAKWHQIRSQALRNHLRESKIGSHKGEPTYGQTVGKIELSGT